LSAGDPPRESSNLNLRWVVGWLFHVGNFREHHFAVLRYESCSRCGIETSLLREFG
jgi:hypothetical protein